MDENYYESKSNDGEVETSEDVDELKARMFKYYLLNLTTNRNNDESTKAVPKIENNAENSGISCHMCGFNAPNVIILILHLKSHSNEQQTSSPGQDINFMSHPYENSESDLKLSLCNRIKLKPSSCKQICPLCGINAHDNLPEHLTSHAVNGRYICQQCSYQTHSISDLLVSIIGFITRYVLC